MTQAKNTPAASESIPEDMLDRAATWLLRIQAAPGNAALQAALQDWLAEHPLHGRAYSNVERVWALSAALPAGTDQAGPTASVSHFSPRRMRVYGAIFGAVAASVLLFILPSISVHLQADYLTASGEVRKIVLDDGSAAYLDSESAIAVRCTEQQRRVALLKGQAFFEVQSNAARPFIVSAADVDTTAVGTAFVVKTVADAVTVTLQSGVVDVTRAAAPSVRLAPGEKVTMTAHGPAAVKDTVNVADVAAWRTYSLVVDGALLSDVVEEIDRHHPGLIVLRDEKLAASRVTGVFNLRQPVSALQAALQPHGGKITTITPYVLVLSKK